jgi:lipopolysaccharide transport system ATP-binding protein
MSFDQSPVFGHTADTAIRVSNLGKCYQIYDTPRDRLKQFVVPKLWQTFPRLRKAFSANHSAPPTYHKEFWALRDVSFELKKGQTLGIIGKNGAGKSTLMQILCGTLAPTSGALETSGRVAALLELGAGFNPEFTGRENVYMNASVLGLSRSEIDERIDGIISFADIGLFIEQPVKTYSSGMFVRLAFSVATSVDPDILVIDEALSVGDGAFSKKSFDRIMHMKDAGKTILFCSHSLYQVEAISDQVIWLDKGQAQKSGRPGSVVAAYNAFLSRGERKAGENGSLPASQHPAVAPAGTAKITSVVVRSDGCEGKDLLVFSRNSTVQIDINYVADPALPPPSVGVLINDLDNTRNITSAGTRNENIVLRTTVEGQGSATITYENFGLLKGKYWVNAFLLCERGVHIYEAAEMVAKLNVEQDDLEIGLVSLPHKWSADGDVIPCQQREDE